MMSKSERILAQYEQLDPVNKEKFICWLDPWYFIRKYVITFDPYKGIQKFPEYDYLKQTVHALHDHNLNIFRKGRQMLFSWVFTAYGVWETQFQFGATDLYTSKRQDDSFELKERAMFIWENLPDWLREPLTEDNKSTMSFGRLKSKMKFLPATDNVGRTFTAGHVFMDEFAHVTCNAAKMYVSIKPTINSGGQCTIFSSPNGPYGKFYDLCGGPEGPDKGWRIKLPNGFFYHYMPYSVHPEHGKEWEATAFQGFTVEEIDQEYRALWIKRGGRIFPEFHRRTHVCPRFEIPAEWPRARGIDFGGANPTASSLVAFEPNSGRCYVYREYKQGGLPVKIHAQNLKDILGNDRLVLGTISDHETQTRIEYADNGIQSQAANKDWDTGYNEITRMLMAGATPCPYSGLTAGLIIFDDLLQTINEMEVYSWKEVNEALRDKPEEPLALNDHIMDELRYILATTKGRRTAFRPIRSLGNKGMMEDGDKLLVNRTPLDRVNSLLIPRFGIGIGEIHKQLGGSGGSGNIKKLRI